ncbi:MAG: ABC transporter permease subunit, partial [Methylocella sp.]
MLSRFVAFTSLGRKALPNQYDLFAFVLILAAFIAITHVAHGLTLPPAAPESTVVSLDYELLPYYALRTTLRMFAAIAASLVFTFVYATLAAKSRRAALVLIPLLDVLQSVPILGFLSFTVTFFLGLFPGSILGAECAAVFAIFTSQAWNMAFSFYQSLRSVPRDLIEVARGFGLSWWQRFWQLETPFAMPGLIWNMMMSMSGGWFFVVASEAISVGDTTVKLPGIGSYLACAIEEKRIDAVFAAVIAMLAVIIAYDQLLFRPLVAFAARFRVELSAGQIQEKSFVAQVFARTRWMRASMRAPAQLLRGIALLRMELPVRASLLGPRSPALSRAIDILWLACVGLGTVWAGWLIVDYIGRELSWSDFWQSVLYT